MRGKPMKKFILCGVAAAVTLGGCSSRPRSFEPQIALAPAKQAEFDSAYANCSQLLVEGKLDSNGRLVSAGVGAAAGATVVALGASAATSAGLYAGMAVASATLVALPFVALASAWGTSKVKRKKKETAIRTAMTGCLQERGFVVTDWARSGKVAAPKKGPAAL
jgi:hypothetical protein